VVSSSTNAAGIASQGRAASTPPQAVAVPSEIRPGRGGRSSPRTRAREKAAGEYCQPGGKDLANRRQRGRTYVRAFEEREESRKGRSGERCSAALCPSPRPWPACQINAFLSVANGGFFHGRPSPACRGGGLVGLACGLFERVW
jgi:hypothetical protein